MGEQLTAKCICSQIIEAQDASPGFFYEIWHDFADGCRMNMEVSRPYPDLVEARAACDAAIPLYLAKRRSQQRPSNVVALVSPPPLPILRPWPAATLPHLSAATAEARRAPA
jgi:hypothetical protein